MNKKYAFIQRIIPAAGMPMAVVAIMAGSEAAAQLNMAAVNTAYGINFDATVAGVSNSAWAGGGFQPTPAVGRLDSDAWSVTGWSNGNLAYGGTQITAGTDYRRGVTLVPIATGGMYGFDDGAGGTLNGMTLGFQPGASDWAPGTITLRVQNNTGSTLTAFDIAYNVYYRDDQGRSSNFNLYVSDDNSTYYHISSQDVVSPVGPAGAAWVANARSTTVSGFNVPNGQYFYIRWRGSDVGGAGSRDEFALDDISVTGRAYTVVRLTSSLSSVNEPVGTTPITASIVNPHPTNPTTVDLVLTSGDPTRINNYTTQTFTFPGGSTANETITITVTDNGACDGSAVEGFELQNIGGGITPSIGTTAVHMLMIDDDETSPVTHAQAFDGGVGDDWPITFGAGQISALTGTGDTPLNQRVLTPSFSWQMANTTATLELATISVVDWTNTTLTARVTSTASSPTQGNDGADSIAFYVNVDGGGFPSDPDICIAGVSNARWGYNTGLGVASTTAGTPTLYQPAAGGNRTTDGYTYVSITIPDGTQSVALRVIAKNDAMAEKWNLDNIRIDGTLCSPVYYSRANGSELTATWSTARTGLPAPGLANFNENATMVIQNGHTVSTTNNASIDLRNLNVETGGSMGLTGVTTLSMYGPTFDLDGSFTSSNDNLELFSPELTTLSGTVGTLQVDNLTLDGFGAIVTLNTVMIGGTLQLDDGDFDANGKEVRLLSSASGTARLGTVGATASYTGRLRIERFIPAGSTDWRLICSPMQNRTVADWTDDFLTAGFPGSYYPNFYSPPNVLWPSVRMYDETNPGLLDLDGLIGVSSTAEPLVIGKGFAAWSGTTLSTTTAFTIDVKGEPTVANTPFSIPMSYTNSPASAAVDGLNLVGNPLPSPIDFGSLALGADVDSSYYIYDPGGGTNVGWDETTQLGTGGCNGNIQSSQGFWLHCTGPANTVTVTESAKVLEPINGGVFSDAEETRSLARMTLSGGGSAFSDEAIVHFIRGEAAYAKPDMVKLLFSNDNALHISTQASGGEDLMINAYGSLTGAVSVPVKVQVPLSGEYAISFNEVSPLLGRACVTFEDLLTGEVMSVVEDAAFAFTIDAAAPVEPARFVLHVGAPVLTSVSHASCAASNDGSITVQGPGPGAWDYTLTAIGGGSQTLEQIEGEAQFTGLADGEYTLTVEGLTGCGALSQPLVVNAPGLLAGEATTQPAACAEASNGSVYLTVMGGTAPYSFAWSNGSSAEDLSDAAPGVYTVTITDANGCVSEVSGAEVGAASGPVAAFEWSPAQLSVEQDAYFFNTGTYGLSYVWDFGDGETSTENEPVHIYMEPGIYTATLTTTNGDCQAVQSHELLVIGSTGVAEVLGSGLSAWTEGMQFIVQWEVEGSTGITAEVLDATGRSVALRSARGSSGRISISGQELPGGVYFIRVKAGMEEKIFKLPLVR